MLNPSDPTKTATKRKIFSDRIVARYKYVDSMMLESIKTNDCLAINPSTQFNINPILLNMEIVDSTVIPDLWKNDVTPMFYRELEGLSEDEKTNKFVLWLTTALSTAVLSRIFYSTEVTEGQQLWLAPYIYEMYLHGIKWGRQQMRANPDIVKRLGFNNILLDTSSAAIRSAVTKPEHAANLRFLMAGAEEVMANSVKTISVRSRSILYPSLLSNKPKNDIYEDLSLLIKQIGINRGSLTASTESIRSHHMASVTEYKLAGVTRVKIFAEWRTARDSRVCPQCKPLDFLKTGKLWPLDDIIGAIPLHPGCRCAAIPHV